jgi:D-psicose/D-tagatose/L-ribulose 3-epimerase
MLYAISNWIYGDEPLRDQFARLARFGYQGIELVGEPARYSIDEVRALCKEFEIPVTSILGWSIWGIPGRDAASPDPDERAAALDYGRQCIDLASALEAPILVVLPAPAGRTAPTEAPQLEDDWLSGYQTEWELAVDSLRRLAGYAGERGVILGLEPINRYETFLVNNLDQALRLIAEVGSGQLKLHLDTFHMNLEEESIAGAISRAGDRLVNLHVSDSNREAPGQGHFDFASLIRALKENDYQGFLTLEPVPPGSDPLLMTRMSKNFDLRDRYARQGIQYLQLVDKSIR